MVRSALIVLEILIGVGAVVGGVLVLSGVKGISRQWLRHSRSEAYLLPALAFVVLVGGTMLTAAGLLLGDVCAGRELSLIAGMVILAWVGAQFAIVGYRHWVQFVILVLGLAVMVLSFFLPPPG